MALVQASVVNRKLLHLSVYDHVQLQGETLDALQINVEAINADEEEQVLDIRRDNLVIDEVNARHIADSLRLHPRCAVSKLDMVY